MNQPVIAGNFVNIKSKLLKKFNSFRIIADYFYSLVNLVIFMVCLSLYKGHLYIHFYLYKRYLYIIFSVYKIFYP